MGSALAGSVLGFTSSAGRPYAARRRASRRASPRRPDGLPYDCCCCFHLATSSYTAFTLRFQFLFRWADIPAICNRGTARDLLPPSLSSGAGRESTTAWGGLLKIVILRQLRVLGEDLFGKMHPANLPSERADCTDWRNETVGDFGRSILAACRGDGFQSASMLTSLASR